MKKWYETNYCDHRDWIMDNLEFLNLNHTETLLILFIDFCNSKGLNVSYDLIKNKLDLDTGEIDRLIYGLSAKHCLKIDMSNKGISYDLTPLFDTEVESLASTEYHDTFMIFEETFKRPLSPTELSKLSELIKIYDKKKIINALRKADAYQKLNIAYIESILKNEDRRKD